MIKTVMTRGFARHYAEMVTVMLVGMGVLVAPIHFATSAAFPSLDAKDPSVMLAQMGLTMTLPMVPWMRWRGHGWMPCLEMTVAMVIPTGCAIALHQFEVVKDTAILMTIKHTVMFAAMFLVM